MQLKLKIEILTLILSIIAIVVSIVVGVIQHSREKKINNTNLESIYLNDIYKEYLINYIPTSRRFININPTGEVSGAEKLIEVLQDIRRDSVYYLYNDEQFYVELTLQCQKLEDYLTLESAKIFQGEQHIEFYKVIQEELKRIYEIISKKYVGKK